MWCAYYDAGRCRSCGDLPTPYAVQLAAKQARAEAALAPFVAGRLAWSPPVASREAGFRNKAKMVVAGTVAAPTLGILDERGAGVDLRACPLYSPEMHALLPVLAEVITRAGLTPYDVSSRRGELKHVLVTESPDAGFMVRFVLRGPDRLVALRDQVEPLRVRAPRVRVVTANLQPEHKAVLEGPDEVVLSAADSLPMRVGGLDLILRPRSFFQTNTEVAAALYAQAGEWIEAAAPSHVVDLYCGVGGFALTAAAGAPGRRVSGVEVSEDAVLSARQAARRAGLDVDFVVGDATGDAGVEARLRTADLAVVNPPRRGLGAELSARLHSLGPPTLIYSSCHLGSLARDLATLVAYRPRRARVLDMFAHTGHFETIVLLERHESAPPEPT